MRRTVPRWRLVSGLTLVLAAACADESPTTPLEPRLDAQSAPASLTVRLREPGGARVCDSLPSGTSITVGWVEAFPGTATQQVVVTCPAWQALLPLNAPADGELFARVAGGSFPSFQIGPRTIVQADTAFGFRMKLGLPVNGAARLDGAPFAGEDLVQFSAWGQVVADEPAGTASSDAAGAWIDPLTRQPFRLHNASYTRECVPGPGMRLVAGPDPSDVATFPSGFRAVHCWFRTSAALRWTHRTADLQLAPGPGVIDATLGDSASGHPFPVAFPTGGTLAYGRSLVHDGALVFAVDGLGGIWTPWNRSDLTNCDDVDPAVCSMYSPSAGPFISRPGGDLSVLWQMADSGNGAARFTVAQRSWDGAYGDYVLYRITIRNETGDHRTVHPAWYLDWNLGHRAGSPGTDTGGPSLGGRLLWVSDGDRYLGSYVADHHPVLARWVGQCCDIGPTVSAADDILRGFLVTTAPRGPTDATTVHGTRLQVPAGLARTFWFAIVAGGTLAELEANAALANDEVDVRRAGGTP